MANPQLVALAPPPGIFIDKLNVSGIELMILNLPLRINGTAIYWRNRVSGGSLDLHRRGLAAI
jgi:hypothetical protein